jgi:hypothetical protein
MSKFDPFNLKRADRQCPRCADGRLNREAIGDLKANLYFDTCSYSKIYTRKRKPGAAQAPDPSPPPAPDPPVEPTPPTKETAVPKENATGLDKKSYQRWYAAGQPDLNAFKKAGCPTAREWKKLQDKSDTPTAAAPEPLRVKPSKGAANTKPTPTAPKPKPAGKGSSCSIQIKALHVSYEGDAADVPVLLQNFVNLLK